MKKMILGILSLAVFWLNFLPAAMASETFVSAPQTETVDKNRLEGWIVRIDYGRSNFRMLDPRGFERRVTTKPGTIGDYRIGDKVRVEIDPGYKRARSIEKLN
mgnify:FL=1